MSGVKSHIFVLQSGGASCGRQGSSEAGVISHSQNEDFSTFQISELSGLQFTCLNLRISRKCGFVLLMQSEFMGFDRKNMIT